MTRARYLQPAECLALMASALCLAEATWIFGSEMSVLLLLAPPLYFLSFLVFVAACSRTGQEVREGPRGCLSILSSFIRACLFTFRVAGAGLINVAVVVNMLGWFVYICVWDVIAPLPRSAVLAVAALMGGCVPGMILPFYLLAEPSPDRSRLLRALGLLQVGIALIFSTAPLVAALAVVYLLTLPFTWHLSIRGRSDSTIHPEFVARRRWLVWALPVLGPAFVCFLLTPSGEPWIPTFAFRGHIQDHLSSSELDLNGEGRIVLSDEVVLTVKVTQPDGAPYNDLPDDQRWRALLEEVYKEGRWAPYRDADNLRRVSEPIPVLRDKGAFAIVYRFRSGGRFPVVAEPVRSDNGEPRFPIIGSPEKRAAPLFFEAEGTLRANEDAPIPLPRYRQVLPKLADPNRVPAVSVSPAYLTVLRSGAPEPIRQWSWGLLERLVRQPEYGLTETDLALASESEGRPPPNAERLARAAVNYFVWSGEWAYTLDRPRRDRAIDSTADFLLNVKAGHCARFASGLALVLRSWGIPCRVVTGLMGAEQVGDGTYVLRAKNRHAWVEALVPRPRADGEHDWVSLDATPPCRLGVSPGRQPSGGRGLFDRLERRWQRFVIDYDRDRQTQLWRDFRQAVLSWRTVPWLALPILAFAVVAVRRLRRRQSTELLPAYTRLLAVLARIGHPPPRVGQTPREHAEAAARKLGSTVPVRVVDVYCRVRFGGGTATAEEARDLDAALDELARLVELLRRSRRLVGREL